MTDLDTLRRALRAAPASPAFEHDALDIAAIVKRGRRVRARRRLAVAGGAACLAAAVFGLTAGLGQAPGRSAPAVGPGRPAPARTHHGTVPRPLRTPLRTPAGTPASGWPATPTPSASPAAPGPTGSRVPGGASAAPVTTASAYAPGVTPGAAASGAPTPVRGSASAFVPVSPTP